MARKYSSSTKDAVERVCPICGETFFIPEWRIRDGRGKTCSWECAMQNRSYPNRQPPLDVRLWAKVDRSGGERACWEWQGHRLPSGYGQIRVNGKSKPVHRIAWELVNGPMDTDLQACHACDNPPCCNPSHIFPGTPMENSQDSVRKGRRPHGLAIPSARLTPDDVRMIRQFLAAGESERKIAARFGVNKTAIHKISIGRTWRHVE